MTKNSDRKAPVLRFKGFTDDWEQRKLEKVVKRITRKNKDIESKLPLTISANQGLISQNNFFNKNVASKDLSNYLLLKKGDFAYNKSYSKGYPYGAIKRLNLYPLGVVSSLYIAFRPTKINSKFLEEYYDANKWYKEIYKIATEGARNHGLLNINPSDFFLSKIIYPLSKVEQEEIAKLLNIIDNLLSLQQRKLKLLKELKKAMLQQMFTDEYSKIPKLRFKEFNNEWKPRKLGNVLIKLYNGQTPSRNDPSFWKGDINWLTSGELNHSLINKTNEKISMAGVKAANLKTVKKGTLVIAITGLEAAGTRGSDGILGIDTTVNQSVMALYPNEKVSSLFLFYWYEKIGNHFGIKYTQGTKQQSYNAELIKELPITFPLNKEEQYKITSILKYIQNLLSLQQNKINKLQKIKHFLLQNMFI